jgi:hypothetical protein
MIVALLQLHRPIDCCCCVSEQCLARGRARNVESEALQCVSAGAQVCRESDIESPREKGNHTSGLKAV